MGSLGTCLHQDCNGWHCENLSLRSFYIWLEEHTKKVRRYDTTQPWGSTQLHGSTKSRKEWVRPKVGKDRVCIFVVWQDGMKMWCCLSTPGSLEYILCIPHSTSVTPVSPYTHHRSLTIYLVTMIKLLRRCTWRPTSSELRDSLGGRDRSSLEIHWEAVIERVWRCTSRPRLSELRDALGGRDRSSLEMLWEAVIERVWRCTWRPRSSELRDALGGHDRASLDMHLEAEIEWTQRCTLRPWSSEFWQALGGRDRVNSEMFSEAVTERVWRCTWRLWSREIGGVLGGSQFGGRHDASWHSIHWLTCNCGNVESWVQHLPRDEKLARSGRLSILGWYCTWCMLYSVLSHDYVKER